MKNASALCNYRPQRSCGKVMFLHLSVILFTGGFSVQGGSLSRGISVQGVSLSRLGVSVWGVSVQGGLCQGDPLPYGYVWAVCILLECILVSTIIFITYSQRTSQANYQLVQECKEITRFLGPCLYDVTDELRSELDNLFQNL